MGVLLGLFVLPFLFIKKKKHWLSIQTEKEFAVVKLGDPVRSSLN